MLAYELQDCKILKHRENKLKKCKGLKNHVLSWRSSVRPSAMTQSCNQLLRPPLEDDGIPAEAGAGMILAPM